MNRESLAACVLVAAALAAAISGGCDETDPAAPKALLAPEWAVVMEAAPDPAVVPDADARARILAAGLPWRVRDKATGIELLLVPAGASRRGASEDDGEAHADERPSHALHAGSAFYVGRYEVTQAEWLRVMPSNPSLFTQDPALPVENVDRFQVQEFLLGTGFTLPTESEWEYACRAGSMAPRYGPLEDVAWTRGHGRGRTEVVGLKAANAFGLHDMLGNVWEWTSSVYVRDEYEACRAGVDVRATRKTGTQVVLRGGSWYDTVKRARASARYFAPWTLAAGHIGFRVVRRT